MGEFHPGVKLSIDSLAMEPGVSRTPIRHAFGQLEREGLVTITSRIGVFARRRVRASACSRIGVFARRLTRSQAEGMYRLKEAIEPLMARWAAERPSAVQRAELRDAVPNPAALARPGRPTKSTFTSSQSI